GAIMSPAVTVRVLDAYGNLVSTDNTDVVTIAIGTNPGGGTLGGTTSVTVSGGIATFSDLSISAAGSGYTLTVSSGGLIGTSSSSFNVNPAGGGGGPGNVIEDFENSETWNIVNGNLTASRTTQAAHDGVYGLDMANGSDWIYQNNNNVHV